jgi:hypothetical protein
LKQAIALKKTREKLGKIDERKLKPHRANRNRNGQAKVRLPLQKIEVALCGVSLKHRQGRVSSPNEKGANRLTRARVRGMSSDISASEPKI